jgi:hypothetical protein
LKKQKKTKLDSLCGQSASGANHGHARGYHDGTDRTHEFAPPRALGEGTVTSLLRMLGTAATKALNRPVAEIP